MLCDRICGRAASADASLNRADPETAVFCHLKSLRDGQNPITEMVNRAVNAYFGCEWKQKTPLCLLILLDGNPKTL
jgi:hypothetical protein